MKKTTIHLYLICILALCANMIQAQSWTVYEADVEPDEFVPAFSESNGEGTFAYSTEVDPDNANNNVLSIVTDNDPVSEKDNIQLRQYTDEDAVTVVLKARTVDAENKNLLFDIDFRSDLSARFAIKVLNDGTYDIDKGGDGIVDDTGDWGFTSTEWNIFRFTKEGADVNVYINEDPTPIFTLSAAGSVDGSGYWRFGDGWTNEDVDTQYDWVAFDHTGAYSPSDQALPAGLTATPLGDWTTYNADVEPGDFIPGFSESNGEGTFSYGTIVDPLIPGNNLLEIQTEDDPVSEKDNIQLRQYTDEDAVTVVVKARTVDDENKGLLFDMDFRSDLSARFAIKILNDGTYDIDKGGDGIVDDTGDWGFTSTEWNIFRFTKDGSEVNIYLNEESTPIFTLSAVGSADGSGYWRFGDGWTNEDVDTQFDWVTWDYSGAYSPEQTRLPVDLLNPPLGDWTVYEADVEPDEFVPAFSESNGEGTFAYGTEVDPDNSSNNVLSIVTDDDPVSEKDNIQLRQYTDEDAVTVVLKARTVDAENKNLLFDIDFRSDLSARFAIKVLNDGTYDIDKGGDGIVDDTGDWGFTSTEWNTFRFTKDGADVNVYINEDSTPIFTLSAAGSADGSGYWRFGDGWTNEDVDTQYDWVIWDYTGAYSPEQTRLPDQLTGEVVETPSIKTLGILDPLFQDIGFPTDYSIESYTVSGSDLTNDITITPPANFEVSIDESNWSGSPISLTQTNGEVENTTIYVRLNAGVVGEYSGDISHTSEGAEEVLVSVAGSAEDLAPEITLTESLTDFVQNLSSPSSSQNYRVSGANLKGDITVTASADFQISSDDATWGDEVVLLAEDRTISNAIVYVRQNATSIDSYTGTLTHTATDASDVILDVAGQVIPDPGINVESDFTSFSQAVGTPSEWQTYTVSGSNLAAGIAISLPEGYEISFSGDLWFTSLTLAPLEGTVSATTLYIRLNAATGGTYEGEILHTSEGLDDVSKEVTGTAGEGVLAIDADLGVSVWPNPASERLLFKREEASSEAQISILSLKGDLLKSVQFQAGKARLEIDINPLPSGVYLIEYESGGKLGRHRLIKN